MAGRQDPPPPAGPPNPLPPVEEEAARPAWDRLTEVDPARLEELGQQLDLGRVEAEILFRRGLGDAEAAHRFLDCGEADLCDPLLLPDLSMAAARVITAIDRGERIVVHGDYDADGITGSALLSGALRRLGAEVEPFVPDRIQDGYGVASRLVEHAGQVGVKLLITVDTGSSAHQELSRAAELGMEVIVCDHHLFDRRPDHAHYFINPQRGDSRYPHRDLCGCAIAHKLLSAICALRPGRVDPMAELDLVAIGLLADQMPLRGEVRALVRMGLECLGRTAKPGLRALLSSIDRDGQRLDGDDVLYQIAPRINAAGRLEKAKTAVDLLLSPDERAAGGLAQRLDSLNRQRREVERRMTEEAAEQAAELVRRRQPAGLVLASADWHLGVVGIGAARIVDRFHRPAVLLSIEGDQARGSARSVGGFDVKSALDDCADLLTRYGGHEAAAGLSLPAASIEEFRQRFAEASARRRPAAIHRPLRLDAQIRLSEIDVPLAEFLHRFGPYGMGHSAPRFLARELRLAGLPRVVGNGHLRLGLEDGGGSRNFIGFSMAELLLPRLSEWRCLEAAFGIRYREGSRYSPFELVLAGLREDRPGTPEGASIA